MANKLPVLENFTKTEIRKLMDACVNFDAGNILGPAYKAGEVVSYGITEMDLYWKTKNDFEKYIKPVTRTGSIVEANKVLEKRLPSAPEGPSKSIPTEAERKSQEEERVRREALEKEAAKNAKANVGAAIKKQQEDWEKLQQQKFREVISKDIQAKVIEELKDKIIYAVPEKQPPKIILSKDEENLIKIAKTNPQLFVEKLSKLIIERNPDIPSETLQPLSQVVAVDVTQSFIDTSKIIVPTGVFSAISKAGTLLPGLSQTAQTEVAKASTLMTVFSENQENLYRTLLVRSVGENLTNKILGFPEAVYVLSETPSDNSFTLKLDQVQTNSFSLQESPVIEALNNPSFDLAKSAVKSQLTDFAASTIKTLPKEGFLGNVSRFVSSQSFDSIAPFIGLPTQASYVGTNFFGKAITTFLPEYAPAITNLTAKLGVDVGITAVAPVATEGVTKTVTPVVAKAAASALTKVATAVLGEGTVAAIGAALQGLGSAVPIIGNLIALAATWLIGKVLEKINWAKIKKFFSDYGGAIGVAFLGGGVLLGSVPMVVVSAPFLYAGWLGTRSLTGFGRNIGNFIKTLGTAFIIQVGTPILIALLLFPVAVALILFIINSGAYIVPPTLPESPFAGWGVHVVCSKEKGPVGVSGPSSSSPVANRAWEITYDLYQGFWCFWNRSPSNVPWNGPPRPDFPNDVVKYPPNYPDLFDYGLYKTNPDPPADSAPNLFWCTWLVVKSYHENGKNIGTNLYVPDMYNDFNAKGKIISADKATPSNIVPGSVVFFHVTTGGNRLNHVGVVYSVDAGGITLVESDTPLKSQTINFKPGGGAGDLPLMEVKYFGLP